jgi:hypothetical protein
MTTRIAALKRQCEQPREAVRIGILMTTLFETTKYDRNKESRLKKKKLKFFLSRPLCHTVGEGNRGAYPFILILSTRWSQVVNFTLQPPFPREGISVPNELEAERAPQDLVWRF